MRVERVSLDSAIEEAKKAGVLVGAHLEPADDVFMLYDDCGDCVRSIAVRSLGNINGEMHYEISDALQYKQVSEDDWVILVREVLSNLHGLVYINGMFEWGCRPKWVDQLSFTVVGRNDRTGETYTCRRVG